MAIFSLEVEKVCLSSLLKYPQILAEIGTFVKENDFFQETHRIIFSIIRARYFDNKNIDKVLVAQDIKNLGIIPKENLEIGEYLDALSYSQVTQSAGIESFKELCKIRIRRELQSSAGEISEFVEKNGDLTVSKIISGSDKIYNKVISSLSDEEQPVDLFASLEETIMERARNPVDETGLLSPYPEFNKMFGGMRHSNGIYAIVSRPGAGKSTWLMNMGERISLLNDCKVLFCDTEMDADTNKFRSASSISSIPTWFFETGQWTRSKDFVKQFNNSKDHINKLKGKFFHICVGNKNIDEVCSIARQWYFKQVGRGNKAVIIYDYIKMTGETIGVNVSEYQVIGTKIDRLNELSRQLKVLVWVACQMNRSAEDGRDDSAAIAISDRLQWFAAWVGIFRQKTLEEIAEDSVQFGTHKLIALKTRFQGQYAAGHSNYVRVMDGKKPKYKRNFICYNVENFRVTECGTLKDIVKINSCRANEQPKSAEENSEI